MGSPLIAYSKDTRTLTVSNEGETQFEYHFDKPQHIHDMSVSISGYYAYVWHSSKPPRRLKIFRLSDSKIISDFVPGYGGAILWTKGDKLLHAWGCGSSCQSIRVYDVAGGILHQDVVSGHELTEYGYYLLYETSGDWKAAGLSIQDVVTGKRRHLLKQLPDLPTEIKCEPTQIVVIFDDLPSKTIPLVR